MSLENSLLLGRYRVLWPLESRKLISSYIGRDEHPDRLDAPVVVRHHLHDLGDRAGAPVLALLDQLDRLCGVRHPGLVTLLDHGLVEGRLVTVHAHTPGMDLRQLCEALERERRGFPPELALFIARRLLATLHQCHTGPGDGFTHGRLTLGCIYVQTTGEPQIGDFGLVALENAAAEAEVPLGFFQTKMSYLAPELTRGGPATPQGDTYSVALLLYRLLAGSNPFRGRSIPETLQRVLQLAPADLRLLDWDQCDRTNALLRRALGKAPADRFQSCLDLSQELGTLQSESDEALRAALAALVQRHAAEDWAELARLTRAVPRSLPSSLESVPRRTAPLSQAFESRAPAFASGLVTEQPLSASQHGAGVRREAQGKRTRRRSALLIPSVLLPAAAIILGLFLGRLGGPRADTTPAAAGRAARPVSAPVEDLRAQLVGCFSERRDAADYRVVLDFGAAGELSGVHLDPLELARTRPGACLLETTWASNVRAPGATSLVIQVAGR